MSGRWRPSPIVLNARRLAAVAFPGGSIAHAYNGAGDRTQVTDPTGQTTTTYDAAARVSSVASPQGQIT